MTRIEPQANNNWLDAHAKLLSQSYQRWLGKPLLPESGQLARDLYEAPFVVVSHDTAEDPIFNYANQTAQRLFEMNWTEFTCLPSRYSAEALHRGERAELMERVTRDNYIDDYAGIRITASGRRFRISQATVWNVFDMRDSYCGQAATFSRWDCLD